MNRLLLATVGLAALQAQIIVDTVAGGKIPNGVPIQDVALGLVSGATWGRAAISYSQIPRTILFAAYVPMESSKPLPERASPDTRAMLQWRVHLTR